MRKVDFVKAGALVKSGIKYIFHDKNSLTLFPAGISDKEFFEAQRSEIIKILKINNVVRASVFFNESNTLIYLEFNDNLAHKNDLLQIEKQTMRLCNIHYTVNSFKYSNFDTSNSSVSHLPEAQEFFNIKNDASSFDNKEQLVKTEKDMLAVSESIEYKPLV